jgi:hypothetical protein
MIVRRGKVEMDCKEWNQPPLRKFKWLDEMIDQSSKSHNQQKKMIYHNNKSLYYQLEVQSYL